jgi:hypothetical protein
MPMDYDPESYPHGVPNPFGPRVHAWNGGPMDQGTRYHGSVWTRPQASPSSDSQLWQERGIWAGPDWSAWSNNEAYPGPMDGLGCAPCARAQAGLGTDSIGGPSSLWPFLWSALSLAGAGVGAYHGYKRNNGSVGWAIGWFVFGGLIPVLALPIAAAEGIGKKKK